MKEVTTKQLEYYNNGDIEKFCSCYHKDVVMLNPDGSIKVKGMKDFKELYVKLFNNFKDVKGEVTDRIILHPYIVEKELWSRVEKTTNKELSGEAIVVYTIEDNLIKSVQFFFKD